MRQSRLQWGAASKSTLPSSLSTLRRASARDVITVDDDETEADERVEDETKSAEEKPLPVTPAAPSALDINVFASFAFKGDVSRGFDAAPLPSILSVNSSERKMQRRRTTASIPATKAAPKQQRAKKRKAAVDEEQLMESTQSLSSLPSLSSDADVTSTADLESVASTAASVASNGSKGRHRCLPPLLPQPSLGHLPPHLLVLGSAPSEASLKAQNYYAFKYNHFWFIMSSLFHFSAALPYPERVQALTSRAVAVWDVCREFSRQGSLDSNLRAIQPNDILSLVNSHPSIRLIANNGGTSSKLFHKHCDTADLKRRGIRIVQLPSSSPAHAMKNAVEAKTEKWKALLKVDDEGKFID